MSGPSQAVVAGQDGLTAGQLSASLGEPVQPSAMPAYSPSEPWSWDQNRDRFEARVNLLANLYLALGILGIVLGVIGIVVIGVIVSQGSGLGSDGLTLQGLLSIGLFLFFAAAGIVLPLMTSYGLREWKTWGRVVAVINAFLVISSFPIGTALGGWTLYVLLGNDGGRYYAHNSSGRPL